MSELLDASPFPFLAGALCLDFANTAFREDGTAVWESLHEFGDLAAWGVEARVLATASAQQLRAAALAAPADARNALGRAVALREHLYHVFAAVAEGAPAEARSLAALDQAQRDAFANRRLVAEGAGFGWDWVGGGAAFDQVLWRVAESAAELLTGGELGRVRRCAGEDCTRLFLDTSRGARRRWCDMGHCGNIAKVRRYRSRHQADA